ncbi:hypothetical protein Sjap_023571 [Stephania japonica]|uniref:SGNH hydrolase-type esterase domain-containing protein n=1 Tax=Stephania japonica TaxID=461633 RepID=A0AAP0EBW3_9MAGN
MFMDRRTNQNSYSCPCFVLHCSTVSRTFTYLFLSLRHTKNLMRPQIILFGDSITELSITSDGWGGALAYTYSRKADVLVRGYSGYNTRWALFLLHHLFPLGSSRPPVAATIFFGANDAALMGRVHEYMHVPIDEYKNNLRRIALHLKEISPSMLIVLITPTPVYEEARLEFLRDGLHLTAEGSALVYEEVVRVLGEGGLVASEMPFDFPQYSEIDWKNPEKAFP